LIAFEYLWYEAWCTSIEAAKAGLQATLVIRHPTTDKLYVNFDQEVFQLMREARCLAKLNVEIPESAKIVLLQEEKFKSYYDELKFILAEYERINERIIPTTAQLVEPHLKTMELKLRPGMVTLTWTSMNIEGYKNHVLAGLSSLEDLISKINDIVESRIQKNLKSLSRAVVVNLPDERTIALDEFVTMQETAVKSATAFLTSKNLEVEMATLDFFSLLSNNPIDPSIDPTPESEIEIVKHHFNNLVYQSLLNCVRVSLNLVKKRACSRIGANILFTQKPFFEVDITLSVPSVRLNPSLDDIQRAINRASVAVLGASKKMWQWGQIHLPEKEKSSFFDVLGQDLEIIKTVLLLTGALHGTKNLVYEYLKTFRKYDWLWKDDKEHAYKQFMLTSPTISHFEQELKTFMSIEDEIQQIPATHCIGALMLNASNLKLQLRNECRHWKQLYSNKVHQLAKEKTYNMFEYMRVTTNKLNIEVSSLDSLKFVMNVLKDIRERESNIEMEFAPIMDMYAMLDRYLPGGVVDKDEVEQKNTMRTTWRKLIDFADTVTTNLGSIQGIYKKQLIWDIRDFTIDIRSFRKDFEENGPLVTGIKPNVAVERLKKFKDDLAIRERKMDVYRSGEELFALRGTKFSEVSKTRKEIVLIDQLYSLYVDLNASLSVWQEVPWVEVETLAPTMLETVNSYDARCKKLPKKLREWEAYDDIVNKVRDLLLLVPLLTEMTKPSIKVRHWNEINGLLSKPLPYQDEDFLVNHVLKSNIIEHKEDVEEICDGADKQLSIERKLFELREHWTTAVFEFAMWKTREIPVLKGFGFVIEDLEEAQLQLQTLLSIRHVAPFRDDVQKFLSQLSDTADTLEMWVKVQMLWTSLESVFLGGDIAKQMPIEAKKFAKINKDWEKLMVRASETRFVIACCGNELLRTTLPVSNIFFLSSCH